MPVDQVQTLLESPDVIKTVITPSQPLSLVMQGVQSIALRVEPPAATKTVMAVGQGPAGPAGGVGVEILGKTLSRIGALLTTVWSYSDAAKTSLVERRELHYDAGGRLEYVEHFNPSGTLMFTRVLQYVDGVLVGTTTT